MNIFVGNLAKEVTQEDLQQAFAAFGQVESATVIKDKFTGENRGFGFVEMPSKTEAEAAINGVKEIRGLKVTANEARPRETGYRGGGGGGGPRKFGKSRSGGGRQDRGHKEGWR